VFVRRPRPSFGTTWDTYLAPFSYKLWLAVLCTLLVLAAGLAITFNIGSHIGIEETDRITQYSLYDSFLYIFGCFCQQGLYVKLSGTCVLNNRRYGYFKCTLACSETPDWRLNSKFKKF
jgi:hypothetical protein